MYVHWERPRLWKVRMRGPVDESTGKLKPSNWGDTIGVVACNAIRAAEGAMKHKPGYRVESVNDAGEIELVVDAPHFVNES